MKFQISLLSLLAFALIGCKNTVHLNKIEGQQINVSDTISMDDSIENFIKPYREHLDIEMSAVLSYAKDTYEKNDGELNTAIGNLMADAVFEEANPIFNKRTGENIDMVLLNHGGIRSSINKGDVTTRTAYEVMPFENKVVIAKLNSEAVLELLNYLTKAKRAHPVSKLKLLLDNEYNIQTVLINGLPLENDKIYNVATNEYLFRGGDGMDFFQKRDTVYDLDYKIRNVLMDYFKKHDTIDPKIDDRFLKLK